MRTRRILILPTVFFFFTFCVSAQVSRISTISPSRVQQGATAFPLVVRGSNFAKNSVVELNGVRLDTYFVSWNNLRATVPAALVANAGNLQVRVVKNAKISNAVELAVSTTPVGSYDWTALTAKLQSFVSTQTPLPPNAVSGLTFMISRHGKIVYAQGFGDQTVNSVLPIASSTKMPSMLAILTLVDDGLLDLDAPLSQYLSGVLTVPPDKAAITMRMLMNHTSGLSGSDEAPCLNDRTTTLRLCAEQILALPLASAPGTRFDYGGNSMQLAGFVAEVLAGESWNQFFTRKIGGPLGLTHYFHAPTQNPRIAGGAFSDVGDYTRFLQMYLAGGVYADARVISPGIYSEMQTDQKRGLPVLNNPGGATHPGYSYGFWHTSAQFLQSQPTPQTAGPELSDPGAFGCTPWIDFEHNFTAIILIQRLTADGRLIWDGARPLIVEQMRRNP